ncbi:MAG: hypothetical protein IPF99_38955 [Deltaproteobacteria bacterium]|nr:hypothetical protein [Deltaproteobacteria bacterium]
MYVAPRPASRAPTPSPNTREPPRGSSCALRDTLPRSLDSVSGDCQGTFCHHIVRLDSDVFRDPQTGRWWLSYSWFTNTPPRVDWERSNHGEHTSLVELDGSDPWAVRCNPTTPQIFVANPHDATTQARLRGACARCGEQLSFTRGRQGEEMRRDGRSWGVAEGPSLFRRGRYVYALYSGSAWDSAWTTACRPTWRSSSTTRDALGGAHPGRGMPGHAARSAPTGGAGSMCTTGCEPRRAAPPTTAHGTCGSPR